MSASSTPGKLPAGSADRMCECARAEGQACPSHRSASATGGPAAAARRPGRPNASAWSLSRPRNQRECSNGDAERDGEPALGPRIDLGDAEVGAGRGVGVLAVRGEPVGGAEHPPPGPLTAHAAGPRSRPDGSAGKHHAVVLVGLVDDAALVVLHEVAGQAQVVGGQVGEPVRGHLVGHREHVHAGPRPQVPALLGAVEERRGRCLRHEDGRGEVVHLDPLPQEVGEVARHLVAEQEVAERLQHDRARRIGMPTGSCLT